jgi:phosphoglycerate dehydrogenase-like enzyme
MKFKKILTIGISESGLSPEYWKKIDGLAEKRISLPKDSPEIKMQLADTDCLLVNPFAFKMEREHIDAAPRLRYIGALSTAYGKIDYVYATTKGITVCNIPGYSTEAVAELAFGVILMHIRELERARKQVREGDYSETTFFNTTEIMGKKFGIIGLGRIGRRVTELAHAFGADVYYWSRNKKDIAVAKYQEVEKLLSECNFISLHLAFTKDTELFMNAARINKIKPGAILINLAPNELVDFSALDKRLAKGDIFYIADHTDEMTPEQIELLSKHKNCILYPPIGWTTKEATIGKQDIFVGNIENFLKGAPTNKVN